MLHSMQYDELEAQLELNEYFPTHRSGMRRPKTRRLAGYATYSAEGDRRGPQVWPPGAILCHTFR